MNRQCPPTKSFQIGMMAYGATPELVFVRVPNERGRWILTHWSVAEVDCRICKAVAGEPCHNQRFDRRYGVGTHAVRRTDAAWMLRKEGRKVPPHKLRMSPADLEEAGRIIE